MVTKIIKFLRTLEKHVQDLCKVKCEASVKETTKKT